MTSEAYISWVSAFTDLNSDRFVVQSKEVHEKCEGGNQKKNQKNKKNMWTNKEKNKRRLRKTSIKNGRLRRIWSVREDHSLSSSKGLGLSNTIDDSKRVFVMRICSKNFLFMINVNNFTVQGNVTQQLKRLLQLSVRNRLCDSDDCLHLNGWWRLFAIRLPTTRPTAPSNAIERISELTLLELTLSNESSKLTTTDRLSADLNYSTP